jgi:uncharacterized protein YcaQ
MDRLTLAQARRIALAAQGFTDPRPTGRVDARHLRRGLGRVGLLQIDSVNVVVRAHELPLFSRLGPYPRPLLTDLIERRRELFEYWGHMASFNPVHLEPALRWRMARARESAWKHVVGIMRDRPGYVEAVLEEVALHGPLTAAQLKEPGEKQGPWWGWADGKIALEWLFYAGRVAAAGRGRNFERLYDLPSRVLPPEVLAAPTPSIEEAHRTLLLHAARSHGIGSARCLADYFRIQLSEAKPRIAELVEDGSLVPVEVAGWPQAVYRHRDAALPRWVRARALLSPFDPLVWERARVLQLFGMHYRIEIYTPAPKRVYGYYVLPFLLGDELVGRVDVKADRKRGVLLALGAFTEPQFAERAPEIAAELASELTSMASWLGLERVEIGDRGDLCQALR